MTSASLSSRTSSVCSHMEPQNENLTWREKVNFNARVRQRLRSGVHRLRGGWWQILQTALAAGVAWFLALLILGHERPEFAPIAAVISLGLAVGERGRRAFVDQIHSVAALGGTGIDREVTLQAHKETTTNSTPEPG